MNRESLLELISQYSCGFNESNTARQTIYKLVSTSPHCAERSHMPGHLTASAWVINSKSSHCLLIHHRKLNKWIQPGGHADGDFDLLRVAQREVHEETGVRAEVAQPMRIFDLDVHQIPAHGAVPAHQHFDVRFLFIAHEEIQTPANDEIFAAAWIQLDELAKYTDEISVLRMANKCRRAIRP